VPGCGFVVGDVSKEVPHGPIFTPNGPSNLRFYCQLPNSRANSIRRKRQRRLGVPIRRETASWRRMVRCSCLVATLVLADVTAFGFVEGTLPHPDAAVENGSCTAQIEAFHMRTAWSEDL
jgi:hypothetical protein